MVRVLSPQLSRGFSAIIVLLIIAIPLAFLLGLYPSLKSSPPLLPLSEKQKDTILVEKITGSKFHGPDGTWWGYNQSKIVRYKDIVFSYYIDNDDDSNKTSSRFVITKKDGENDWAEGAILPTSRPGNLLIDSRGVLHAFVFEPFDVKTNDSWGRILHYWFPNSRFGDIKNYEKEIVVDNDGKGETANIRVGAAIGADDTIAISFGLTKNNPFYREQSEHIYYKNPDEERWNHTFTDNLPHDYYYPFTLVSGNNFFLLPVQDDYNGLGTASTPYPNIYQKILFMEVKNGVWQNKLVADLSNHELAKTRPRLLEQEDLYTDREGKIHILYKEFLNPETEYVTTMHHHLMGNIAHFEHEMLKFEGPGVSWVRFVEVEGNLFYLATSFRDLYIGRSGSLKLTKIDLPENPEGVYPYVATAKNGTKENEFVDVLLLGADQKLFQEGKNTNYYLRIPKAMFTNLK